MPKQIFCIIAEALALLTMLFIFAACKQPVLENIQSVQYTYEVQNVTTTGALITNGESLDIYYHDNYILYKRPYVALETFFRELDSNGVAYLPIIKPTNYYYIMIKYNSRWVYRFDSINVKKPQKISIDTFRKDNSFLTTMYFNKNEEVVIEKKLSADKNILIEKSVPKVNKGYDYTDTIVYYFDKRLINVKYSLSKYLDSVTQSKLVKVVGISNKIRKGEMYKGKVLTFNMPKIEFRCEIKKNEAPESKEITDFINRFKSKESTLYPDK